jgi:anti-sigma factor RsiW
MNHIADNQDALLDYLYEEGDPAERLAIAKHLQQCAACSIAVLEFQNVRGMLSDWTPPAAQLGFRVVQEGRQSSSASLDDRAPEGRSWASWGWLQAAAAVLIFASGVAVSQLDVDYQDGALIVQTRTAPAADSIMPVPSGRDIELPVERVSSEPVSPASPTPVAASDEVERLLQRVRAMIDQSEQRQQRELALRLSQVAREVDMQHQADLLRVQQEFGQQQDATMEYLVRTSGGTK